MRRVYGMVAAAAVLRWASPACAQDKGDDDWTGFYIRAEARGANGKITGPRDRSDQSADQRAGRPQQYRPDRHRACDDQSFSGSDNKTALLYGAFLGGQFQTRSWVFGLEGDVQAGATRGPLLRHRSAIPATALSQPGQ